MAAQRPFLTRALEEVKRYAQLTSFTRGLTESQLLEDIRRAHASVYEDLIKTIGPEARYFLSLHNVTVADGDEYARLPGSFRRFTEFVRWDEKRLRILNRRLHTPGYPESPIGVMLMPHAGLMKFAPKIAAIEAGAWELWFESGPIELHFGNPVAHINVTGATLINATKTITLIGAFTKYTFKVGDIFKVTDGTGVTTGRFAIAGKTDDDNITLTTDPGGSDPADVAGDVYKIDSIVLTSSPTKGEFIDADAYYTGTTIHIISGDGIQQTVESDGFTAIDDTATLLNDWLVVPDKDSVYEIRPSVPGHPGQFDDIICVRAALKYRRIAADDPKAEASLMREIKHILGNAQKAISDANTDAGPAMRKAIRPGRKIW